MNTFVLAACLIAGGTAGGLGDTPGDDLGPAAAEILSDSATPERRDELIEAHRDRAAELLKRLADGMEPGTAEERRRIPMIWRVAVAAGKRNGEAELGAILDAALPKAGEPLREWQAVVIGGGLINGAGLAGAWPGSRIEEILERRPELRERWEAAVARSFAMADDEKVAAGTRYDALRMVALAGWDTAKPVLERYLVHENAELQQGAVSGLSDVRNDEAPRLLLANVDELTGPNRALAVEALVRDGGRYSMAKEALRQGVLTREEINAAGTRVRERLQAKE